MSGSARETLLDVCEWSGGYPGCPKVVGTHSRKSGRPYRMYLSGQEPPPECLGGVGKPSRMSGRGWAAL